MPLRLTVWLPRRKDKGKQVKRSFAISAPALRIKLDKKKKKNQNTQTPSPSQISKKRRWSSTCKPLIRRQMEMQWDVCVGVHKSNVCPLCDRSPVSRTVVFSVRNSPVLVVSSMSWGTKPPLCVWGFHPVTQGAVCVWVCVCTEVAEPPGGSAVRWALLHGTKEHLPSGPSSARKWLKICLPQDYLIHSQS